MARIYLGCPIEILYLLPRDNGPWLEQGLPQLARNISPRVDPTDVVSRPCTHSSPVIASQEEDGGFFVTGGMGSVV